MELQAENTPFVIPFTKGAFDVIKGYDDEVEKQIKEATYNGDTSTEMMARTFEKVWKYALLFTASKYGPTSTMVVEQDSAGLAVLLLDYEMRKFRANADRFNDTEQSKFLREIVDWIETLGRTAFNLSQFTRKFQRRRKQEREEALDTLQDIGIWKPSTSRAGRRSTKSRTTSHSKKQKMKPIWVYSPWTVSVNDMYVKGRIKSDKYRAYLQDLEYWLLKQGLPKFRTTDPIQARNFFPRTI